MTDEDRTAHDNAFMGAAWAADLATGGNCSQPLSADHKATLKSLTTDELLILRDRLMKDAGKRYGVSITNPLAFATALQLDGVRGLKRMNKGRTTDEQIAIIQRMRDELLGTVPERTFFQKLFGAR
jgi:hypothetical protein